MTIFRKRRETTILMSDDIKDFIHKQYPQMGENVINELQKLLNKVKEKHFVGGSGINHFDVGMVLTPKNVVNVNNLDWGRIRNYLEYCEIEINPNQNVILLFDDSIVKGIKSAGSSVMLTTLKFQNSCCECGLPPKNIAFVETNVRRTSPWKPGYRMTKPSKEITRALQYERIWFPLPLCTNHRDWRTSVRIIGKGKYEGGKIILRFANIGYGKRFASINNLPYLHVTPLIALKRFVVNLGIWIAILGAIFSVLTGFSSSGDLLQYEPFRTTLNILFVGLLMMALGVLKDKPQKPY
jgi:hypothetical protein